MTVDTIIALLTFVAFFVSWASFYPALRFAQKHDIVDLPNYRKLQRVPVPVLGGIPVALGVFVPLCIAAFFFQLDALWYALIVMLALSVIGVLDDVFDIDAWMRFSIEMFLVWFLLWQTDMMIMDLHGLFDVHEVSPYVGLPLSLFAGVGIINAINMIDGVDGYSSGYGIMANIFFAVVFFYIGDEVLGLFSLIAAASLLPFFVHNVFGSKSKMYIGDGGALLIGMVMVWDVFALLAPSASTAVLEQNGICLVAMVLAVLCIPIFDTLRVMVTRICMGRLPFSPDRIHLHHIFIRLGFSHVGTSICIILLNVLIVLIWYLCSGFSYTVQFIVVCTLGFLFTCGIYYLMEYAHKRHTGAIYHAIRKVARWTHLEQLALWKSLERIVDYRCKEAAPQP